MVYINIVVNGIASNPQTSSGYNSVPAKVQFEHLLYQTHVIDLVWCAFFQFNWQVFAGKAVHCSASFHSSCRRVRAQLFLHKLTAKLSIARWCSSPKSRRRTCWSISGPLAKWENEWAVFGDVWRLICTILVYHNLVTDKVSVQMASLSASSNLGTLVVPRWLETSWNLRRSALHS